MFLGFEGHGAVGARVMVVVCVCGGGLVAVVLCVLCVWGVGGGRRGGRGG